MMYLMRVFKRIKKALAFYENSILDLITRNPGIKKTIPFNIEKKNRFNSKTNYK